MTVTGEDRKWMKPYYFSGSMAAAQMPCPLCDRSGVILSEGSGPATFRLGVDSSMGSVLDATGQCLAEAKLSINNQPIVACLALAGATEPLESRLWRTTATRSEDDCHDGRACRVRWSTSR
jgi:hypothetical protein